MPDVGEGIAEAELVEWLVAVGDAVQVDEPVAEVMTDKATIELPSLVAGNVSWLGGSPGDRIAIGAPLIRFQVDGPGTVTSESTPPELAPEPASAPPELAPEPATPAPSIGDSTMHKGSWASSDAPVVPVPASAGSSRPVGRPIASPAVRRRALESGIDLRLVRGTGPVGRIGHVDLDRCIDCGAPVAGISTVANTAVTDVRVIGLRRMIAERMSLAKAHIPHITYVEEVDVTEVERLRQSLNKRRSVEQPKLTLLPFLVCALVRAIAEHPELNAHFDDDAGVVHQYGGVHVGIATQTLKGLVVPVLRHAEARDIWSCAEEIKRLADVAKEGKLDRGDLSDSTITITSLGALGGLITTPIINYPEVAVIGVNKMQIRPVWDGNHFIPRNMMNLSSGFDHRIIDGWNAAIFVRRIKALLEQPASMFIQGA